GDWHPAWRTADIVESDLVAEGNRGRVAAVFAADTDFKVTPRGPPSLDGQPHEATNPLLVDRLKWIGRQDLRLDVVPQELAFGIIARVTVRRLGEIVRAETEELGFFGQLIGDQARPRQFDHGANLVVDLNASLCEHLVDCLFERVVLDLHLLARADQRNHDFGDRVLAFLLEPDRGADDGARLHLHDLRKHDAEAAAAHA